MMNMKTYITPQISAENILIGQPLLNVIVESGSDVNLHNNNQSGDPITAF